MQVDTDKSPVRPPENDEINFDPGTLGVDADL